MSQYEITSAHENRILTYIHQQAKDHGIVVIPFDDSLIAYAKHDWNEAGLGSWNCETVQAPLLEVLENLRNQCLVERVNSGYRLKEGIETFKRH